MAKLSRLKPSLSMAPLSGAAALNTRPNVVERKRGYAGVMDRLRIRQRDQGLCQECVRQGTPGPGWLVDHIIPLFEGGSDDDSNKETICSTHHNAKSAEEAKRRAIGIR